MSPPDVHAFIFEVAGIALLVVALVKWLSKD